MSTKEAQKPLSREEAKALIEACHRLLEEQFGAQRVIPFGSVIGEGSWHVGSDIDLAVEGLPPERFFQALSAVQELVPPHIRVDLVPLEDVVPELRARILGEVEMPEDPILALKELIEDELRTLERVVERMREAFQSPPTQLELHGVAAYIHDFYTGIESIFERIAVQLGEGLPRGEYWHADLLDQVAAGQEGKYPAVIDKPLRARLKDYLEFRHFFRHAYGAELKWVRLRPLAEGMSEILDQLKKQLEAFFDRLSGQGKKQSAAD